MATNLNKISRRKTRKIKLKNVYIGGDAPISVQTMTNTDTSDVKETLNQIKNIEKAGADLVRVSCPDQNSTKNLRKIISYFLNYDEGNNKDLLSNNEFDSIILYVL